jgi:hypothetical protein
VISRRDFLKATACVLIGAPLVEAKPKKKIYYAIHSMPNKPKPPYGWMEHGFAVLDNHSVIRGKF